MKINDKWSAQRDICSFRLTKTTQGIAKKNGPRCKKGDPVTSTTDTWHKDLEQCAGHILKEDTRGCETLEDANRNFLLAQESVTEYLESMEGSIK
jgi:hypothetical protein